MNDYSYLVIKGKNLHDDEVDISENDPAKTEITFEK